MQRRLSGQPGLTSEVSLDAGAVLYRLGPEQRPAGPQPGGAMYGSFASFSDPDGNGRLLQEITARALGR